MGVRFYDEALLAKLHRWCGGQHLTLIGVDESRRFFELLSDTKNDSPIQLPLIVLSRPGGYVIDNKNQRPLAHNGSTYNATLKRSTKLNAIPISIKYQLDIYTRYLAEADEYARNFVFNIINYPKLTIDIPYESQGIVHDSNIRLASDVDDNSDIPERLISGQFTRLTISLIIDDAYLFDVRIRDNISITEISLIDGQNNSKIDTLLSLDK